jgi:TRAP-type uncharacterized transport system fused permease subunit
MERLVTVLAAVLTICATGWALEIQQHLAWSLYPQQFFAAALAFALALAFLTLPARQGAPRDIVPWYDMVLAAVGFCAAAWIAVRYPELVD